MFQSLEVAPPDAILGLSEVFKKDPNPKKINLTVGVYKDGAGKTPILASVKEAERRVLERESTKSYLPIEGPPELAAAVQGLLFGADHEIVESGRAATAQTPGGTGALRIAADLVRNIHPGSAVWLSEPTWPNHQSVFNAAGLNIRHYAYYDADKSALAFDEMIESLEQAMPKDIVLFHACCHNPTGTDPTREQWKALAKLAKERKFIPFFDFAYQGFANGIAEDAAGLLEFCYPGCELLVASSFSKNFGLYNERVGALTLVTVDAEAAEAAMSHLRLAIRVSYSNPPAHGGLVVAEVLGDPALRKQWEGEVAEMRERIHKMRKLFVETLKKKGVKRDFSFLTRQNGMFSFSGLTKEQVEALRKEHSVYVIGNGRINVAGMTESNMEPLCAAIAAVLEE